MNKRFTCVDLFSGAGGLSKGFLDAGYNVVLGVDFDDAALKTFKENHGDAQVMKIDLFDHSNIDIIVSPPIPAIITVSYVSSKPERPSVSAKSILSNTSCSSA